MNDTSSTDLYYQHKTERVGIKSKVGACGVQVRKLTASDLTDVKRLYCEAFDGNKYFIEHGDTVTKEHLPSEFSDDIEFCVVHGESYGAYDSGHLVGIILAFDYFVCMREYLAEFDKIFGIQRKWEVWPYKQEINDQIEQIGDPVSYIMAVAVAETNRRKGIASNLLDRVIKNSRGSVATDVSAPESMPMYHRRGFKCSKIEEDYYLARLIR